MSIPLTPDLLISAYSQGVFPMAESRDGEIFWNKPEIRAIFDIYNTKISRSTRQLLKKNIYRFGVDEHFREVIEECSKRKDTWINDEIIENYTHLQELGFAHSIEVYRDNKLVGGLYGVKIGAAFFGESMFNLEPNTAKLAFAYLLEILKYNYFILLDSQFLNPFTAQLGAIEISDEQYMWILQQSLQRECSFELPPKAF
jgi:leucyl/phenylalanyl-tRNA--protein transferase